MCSFLPSVFPSGGPGGKLSIAIPNHDASVEQRSHYPFTFTSVKTVEDGNYTTYAAHASQPIVPFKPRANANANTKLNESTPATPMNPKTLAGILIVKMDPLAALYSPEWMREIEQEFRDKIRSFLSEDEVSKVLGKTRCRDCLYYFEKSTMKPSKTRVKSIGSFLSFWWGTSVKIGDVVYHWSKLPKDQRSATEATELTHLDNGDWIHSH